MVDMVHDSKKIFVIKNEFEKEEYVFKKLQSVWKSPSFCTFGKVLKKSLQLCL